MRRIGLALSISLLLIGGALAQGGMGPGPGMVHSTGGGCSPGTEASTFLARTSGLSGTETDAYCNLINGLVADSLWTKLDALYIFATKDTTTANLNLKSTSFGLTQTGTVTFTADQGYTGDASTGNLNTGFTPSTAGGNYALNAASFGVYALTSRTTGQNYAQMGTNTVGLGTSASDLYPWFTDNNLYGEINANGGGVAAPANAQGMYAVTRTASNALAVYRNGSSFTTAATTSVALPDQTFFILAAHGGSNTTVGRSGDKLSAAFIGGSLNGTEAGNLSTRINAYMTALGINVY